MTMLDQTLTSELLMRKPTKKLIVKDTTTCRNKSITKYVVTKQKHGKTKVNINCCIGDAYLFIYFERMLIYF